LLLYIGEGPAMGEPFKFSTSLDLPPALRISDPEGPIVGPSPTPNVWMNDLEYYYICALKNEAWEFNELQMWVFIEKIVDQNVKYFFIIQI